MIVGMLYIPTTMVTSWDVSLLTNSQVSEGLRLGSWKQQKCSNSGGDEPASWEGLGILLHSGN